MAKRSPRKNPPPPGRMLRPKAVVLDKDAMVPPRNVIKPPPNRFTHKVKRSQPYFYEDAQDEPDGEFAAGTRVVLMVHDGGASCRVVDGHGLYVETAYGGLHDLRPR
jgi:hypothetical protein